MDANVEEHNREVRQVWEALEKGSPIRVPVLWRIPAHAMEWAVYRSGLNRWNCTLYDLMEDFDLAWEVNLFMQRWLRGNVNPLCDLEMGLPEEWEGPSYPHDTLEAAWLGAPLDRSSEVPRVIPVLSEDPQFLLEKGIPHPLKDGVMAKVVQFYGYCDDRRRREDYLGRPVGRCQMRSMTTHGPFTLFCALRGAQRVCLDIYTNPHYFHQMMEFITGAILTRIRAVASFAGISLPTSGWCNASDDSICLLSAQLYREHVMPYHRRIYWELGGDGPHGIHLCGAVQHLIPIIAEELNVRLFETGFPVDLGELRKKVGPHVRFRGNIHGEILRSGPPELIKRSVAKILNSGVMHGGQFVFTDGGHSVGVPLKNLDIAYQEVKRIGVYQ